jgi:hypothetical protein
MTDNILFFGLIINYYILFKCLIYSFLDRKSKKKRHEFTNYVDVIREFVTI